jgi:hypothetical protein
MSNIGLMTKLEPVGVSVERRGVSRRRSGMFRFHDFLRIDHLPFLISLIALAERTVFYLVIPYRHATNVVRPLGF